MAIVRLFRRMHLPSGQSPTRPVFYSVTLNYLVQSCRDYPSLVHLLVGTRSILTNRSNISLSFNPGHTHHPDTDLQDGNEGVERDVTVGVPFLLASTSIHHRSVDLLCEDLSHGHM